jgi:hypothetical protein
VATGLPDLPLFAGFLRVVVRVPLRELVLDLGFRFPERVAVLLGMLASLVASASFAPFATLVTSGVRRDRRFGGLYSHSSA